MSRNHAVIEATADETDWFADPGDISLRIGNQQSSSVVRLTTDDALEVIRALREWTLT